MKTPNDYVPILKWKAAEQTAMEKIDAEHKKLVTPIAELVLPSVSPYSDSKTKTRKPEDQILDEMVEKMINERVVNIPKEFKKVWSGAPLYFDVSLLHNRDKTLALKCDVLQAVIEGSFDLSVNAIPVINVSDDKSILEVISKAVADTKIKELCIRVTPASLKNINELDGRLKDILKAVGLEYDQITLLIDLKYIESLEESEIAYTASQKINNLDKFGTFVFASGAFPIDMTDCPKEEATYIERKDWISWKKNIETVQDAVRKPVYADYSIRHPLYNDSLQFFESTSTLKYTIEESWFILKGEKRNFGYYLANADVLVKQPEYAAATFGEGSSFSFGDLYIFEKAKHFTPYTIAKNEGRDIKGTGRTQDWIAAGISHHTAIVIKQLSNIGD